MTSIEASKKFGVPESTIRKHKDNRSNRVGSGRPSVLSVDQEQYLVALLQELQSIGVRLTREILAKITGDFIRMIKKSNKDVSRHWFQNFFKRNSDKLKMKKELKLERSRRDNFTEEVRSNWFSKLKGKYVCVPADKKFVFEQQGGTGKAFTTILLCTSASGDVLPPLVVYAAKAVNTLWCAGGVPGTTYKCSESGWISEEIFTDWFKNLFLEQTKNIERPLLLVMDNHPAHINIDVIDSNETLSNNFSSTTVVQHSIDASANNSILQSENSMNAMIQTDAEQESISNIAIIKNSTIAPDQSLINFVPTDWLDTDGVWSTHITAQIILPVDDIEDEGKTFCELTTVPIEASPFSPTTAVRSIVTSCLQEMQPPPPPVTSKRVRLERRYGEEITAESLLQELKDKKATKDAKVKQPPKKRKKNQNSTSTNNVNSSS
ncbi:unnamed protein product [Rotaria sp. Silwood1]|nr:unnamed protein product [Rotaria sp. Silwood1]